MIETQSGHTIGMVYTYKVDFVNRHAFICTYLDAKYRGQFYGAEASILFVDYIFSYFDFRKIYAEIYEYNQASMQNSLKGGFVSEGILRNHRWYKSEYHDMYILALYKEVFYQRFGKVLRKLKVK
jgi:RimJ/RimL family protein N-acetyltransferase